MKKLLFLFLLLVSPAWAQTLTIEGDIPRPVTLTRDDLAKLTVQTLNVEIHNKPVVFEGVQLYEVLRHVGVPGGKEGRPKAVRMYVVARAQDGFKALFAVAELDPEITGRKLLLAWSADGKPLDAFRLVAPSEKAHTRWVFGLKSLKIGTGE